MQMQVPLELLIPRMQYERKTNLTSELSTSEQQQCLRSRVEQRLQQRTLIPFAPPHESIQLVWQRKHLMEVGNRQQLALP